MTKPSVNSNVTVIELVVGVWFEHLLHVTLVIFSIVITVECPTTIVRYLVQWDMKLLSTVSVRRTAPSTGMLECR
jgi:hypothetical protein